MYNFFNNIYNGILKLLFFPKVIANLFQALAMDEHGYSLKKVGFVYATIKAALFSDAAINSPTTPASTKVTIIGFWLIYGGILVGIYSFSDITDGLSKVKGTPTTTKKDEKNTTDLNNPPTS